MSYESYGQQLKPHRGTTLLVFGVLGLIVCPVFAILAWVMANADLREIAAGTMDREGEQTTKIAKILGIVGCVLCILSVVLTIVIWIVMFAFLASSGAMN